MPPFVAKLIEENKTLRENHRPLIRLTSRHMETLND
jgi:hypothetical protein